MNKIVLRFYGYYPIFYLNSSRAARLQRAPFGLSSGSKTVESQRGILLRHLVLPQGLAGTRPVMRFIAQEISTNTYVNIMPQYRPCGRAAEIKELSFHLSQKDFETALEEAVEEGIERLDSRRRRFVLW